MTERSLLALLLPGLAAAMLLGVALGPYGLPPGRILAILGGDRSDLQAVTVLLNIRMPRVLAAAGAAYQTVFRDPLVSPDILGVAAGASFGAVLGILLGMPVIAIQMLGFGTGLATVGLVLALSLALRGTGQVLVMVLCGIAVGALAGAGIALVKLLADPEQQLPAITFWLMGSLTDIKRPDIAAALPAMLPLLALRWRIGLLAMGEDEARAMGVPVGRLRILVIACATLMTAAAVATAGVIGWVGLMVPHMARLLTGPRFDRLLPTSVLIGAAFMVLVDTAARSIAQIEVPLGILTAVLGAPIFIGLLARGSRGWSE